MQYLKFQCAIFWNFALIAIFISASSPIYSQEHTVVFLLEGIVLDKDNQVPIPKATVEIRDQNGISNDVYSDSSGQFNAQLLRNSNYSIVVSKEGYLNAKGNVTTLNENRSKTFYLEYNLKLANIPHLLPVLFFEFNSLVPLDSFFFGSSMDSNFNDIAKWLDQNPNLRFSLYALKGKNEPKNFTDRRAHVFYELLDSLGVDMERITIDNSNVPEFENNSSVQGYLNARMPAEFWKRSAGLILEDVVNVK